MQSEERRREGREERGRLGRRGRRGARERYAWEVEWDEIELGDRIGRGGMGAVYKARWREALCVVKTMHAHQTVDEKTQAQFRREIDVMRYATTAPPSLSPRFDSGKLDTSDLDR